MKNKKILVTGGSGFIGSNLCTYLSKNNEVVSYDLKQSKITSYEQIVGHTKDLNANLGNRDFDMMFHFGEYARVEQSLSEFDKVFAQNTACLGEVLRFAQNNTKKFIYSGSSTKFYKNGMGKTLSPYTLTKAVNSELVENFCKWYNINYAIVYFYNVYGSSESDDSRYGTLIAKALAAKKLKQKFDVTAPGNQTRNFTHIDDTLRALELVGDRGFGDGYKIGSSKSYSVLDVVEKLNLEYQLTAGKTANRLSSSIANSRMVELGWFAEKDLMEYLNKKMDVNSRGQ